jgi:hypothetical protein
MEAESTSETSVNVYRFTLRKDTQGSHINCHFSEIKQGLPISFAPFVSRFVHEVIILNKNKVAGTDSISRSFYFPERFY